MGSFLSLPATLLNLLLPFTNKSTPLIQDLIHTAVLCGTLYFGPQLVELYHNAQSNQDTQQHQHHENDPTDAENEPLIQQPDPDPTLHPPPLAPTPPEVDHPLPNHAADAHNHNHNIPFPPDHDPQEGPANANANPNVPRPTPQNRTIGAKKAKSLARKDQRRAYFEFHRQEALLRRQREEAGRAERDALLSAEKARRSEAERAIEERQREEREWKKEVERQRAEEERVLREEVVEAVREGLLADDGCVSLVDLAWSVGKDLVWVERLVRASGVLGQVSKKEDGVVAVMTGEGWAVRLDARLLQKAYAEAAAFGNQRDGKVGFDEFGGILEKCVRERTKAIPVHDCSKCGRAYQNQAR